MSEPREEGIGHEVGTTTVEPIHDYYLLVLTRLLEQVGEDSSIGMSFNVSGGLVYGKMISREAWEKLWLDQLSQANEWVGDVLTQVTQMRDEATDEDEDRPPTRFVHLKEATYLDGGTRYRVGLWRAPLAQIAGWSNGTLD